MQHFFLTDPFNTLQPGHDSSLALMRAALKRGHKVWQAQISGLYWHTDKLLLLAQAVLPDQTGLKLDLEIKVFCLSEATESAVWMRKDPPVDQNYIQACQLLRLAKVPVFNNPNSLLSCEEKLLALEFPNLTPKTVISQDLKFIKSLVMAQEALIAKPVGGKAGEGILVLKAEDKNLGSLLELLTSGGKRKIILQEFLSEARVGDKRVFLLAGDPIGAVLRVPKPNDNRANMAAGGSVVKTNITDRERQICAQVKPRLLELGLYIVGLDIIGEKLTEINITSPTCLEEIAQLDGTDPAGMFIEWSETYSS
jgi:glutathione synthase